MGIIGNFFKGGDKIKGALDGAGSLAKNIREAVTGEEHQKNIAELQNKIDLAQIELNKLEAAGSPMQRSWRPALAWCIVFVIAFHFIVNPLMAWISVLQGQPVDLPVFDVAALWPIILGLIGYRSYEKYAEKNKK